MDGKAADYSHFELLSFLAIKSFVTLFFFFQFYAVMQLIILFAMEQN